MRHRGELPKTLERLLEARRRTTRGTEENYLRHWKDYPRHGEELLEALERLPEARRRTT